MAKGKNKSWKQIKAESEMPQPVVRRVVRGTGSDMTYAEAFAPQKPVLRSMERLSKRSMDSSWITRYIP